MKTIFLFMAIALFSIVSNAQTSGDLDVSVTTSEFGGNYAPKNCVAIWVEDDQGNFVKTLLSYAQMYRIYLTYWKNSTSDAGVPYNTTDAISGATVNSHGTRTCSWDGTDYEGTGVSDGTYRLCMELTDRNNTGNYSYFTFTKADAEDSQTPANEPSFNDISFSWMPSGNAINDVDIESISILPNPTKGLLNINADNYKKVEVYSITGELVLKSASKKIDITNQAKGVYFVRIETENAVYTRRVLKE